MGNLAGRVAFVTGGARGIGAAYAKGLAKAGAAVAICDLVDGAPVVAAIEAEGGRAMSAVVDVTDATALEAFVGAIVDAFGRLDILVNNAALFATLTWKPMLEISSDEFDRIMRINVRGPFECAKAVLPQMRAQGYGKIINIASTTVYSGPPNLVHYTTSKAAIIGMTRCFANELGGDGIRANSVAPGFTVSDTVLANPIYTNQLRGQIAANRAIKRNQEPEDLVGAVVFLSSPESDFITGQTVVVDGGRAML